MMKTLFISTFIFLSQLGIQAQIVTISRDEMSIHEVFTEIESQTKLHFVFSEEDVNVNDRISLEKGAYELEELLKQIASERHLRFKHIEENIVVTNPAKSREHKSGGIIYQTVRGVVMDGGTGGTLPAANVYVVEFPESSGVTDLDGKFELKVPVGRANLAISYIGYQTALIPMLINTGQEQFLTIGLEASVEALGEVVVEAERDRAKTVNELAYASGRGFNVLEANRYAGTLGDPARMARSFAGVIPARDDRNDIIIRGNSPLGIQWRLDGIEIPNPNHYGGIGLTGSTTTLLNMNLIDDSDFLMGAFPSEYGNALSGVFDLNMKKVNPERRQYRFQTGWNGFEFGAEGPFTKKKDIGTYSLTYRYSFLDVVDAIGIDFGVLPQFQDLTGKFDFNLGSKTSMSLIGIWGTSFIELDDHDQDSADLFSTGQYLTTGSDLLLGGVNLNHRVNEKVSIKTGISAISTAVKTRIDTFSLETDQSARVYTDDSGEDKYSMFFQTDCRNNGNLLRIGMRWDTYVAGYNSYAANVSGGTDTTHDEHGQLNLARVYVENEYRFTDRFRARGGIHTQYFLLNGSYAVEPRFALRYLMSNYHAVSLSYGNHHQLQPRTIYFVRTRLPAGGSEVTNKNLDFSGAHHLCLAYDFYLSEHMRVKAETYYQHLYDIPVSRDTGSTFSMLNVGADFYIPGRDSLVNEGLGRNYGLELTLERFLNKGYYFMLNGTVFRSEYQALDGVWRNTAFDMRYTANALGGYEKWFGQRVALGFDLKLTYAGGRPYTAVDEPASQLANDVIYKEKEAFEKKHSDYFRTDLKLYYRVNYNRVYMEFAMDLLNLTDHQNVFQQSYDPRTGQYKNYYQMAFFPMFTFRCLF